MQEGTDQPPLNHESAWAREGDEMLKVYPNWSAFASKQIPAMRWLARNVLHGFDFRVESENGTKRMIRI